MENQTRKKNEEKDLLARDMDRLLKSALAVEAPPVGEDLRLARTASAGVRAAPAFPLWGVGVCALCIALLGALAYSLPPGWMVLRILAAVVPAVNLALGPVAALAIVVKRRSGYERS